jgi:hypothetical protein
VTRSYILKTWSGNRGHAVAQLVEALRYKPEGRGFDSQWCHWNDTMPHYGLRVDSASKRNDYQEYFLGEKAAGAYSWQTYHFHVPTVLKSGSLNLLEPLGPVQAWNGIALPLLCSGNREVQAKENITRLLTLRKSRWQKKSRHNLQNSFNHNDKLLVFAV